MAVKLGGNSALVSSGQPKHSRISAPSHSPVAVVSCAVVGFPF